MSDNKVLTAQEVADMLGVNRETIYRLTRRGELPHQRIGSHLRFSSKKIEEWLNAENTYIEDDKGGK